MRIKRHLNVFTSYPLCMFEILPLPVYKQMMFTHLQPHILMHAPLPYHPLSCCCCLSFHLLLFSSFFFLFLLCICVGRWVTKFSHYISPPSHTHSTLSHFHSAVSLTFFLFLFLLLLLSYYTHIYPFFLLLFLLFFAYPFFC